MNNKILLREEENIKSNNDHIKIMREKIERLEFENSLLKSKFDKSLLDEYLNNHSVGFAKREIFWLRLFLILSMIANAIFVISFIRS